MLSRYLFPILTAVFAAVCLYSLRSDIALISVTPLLRSWNLVMLATLCSVLNYALRIFRWQRYLAKPARTLPLGFTALTYIAGFAFTLSPGKVGEMARARYYSSLGISLTDTAGAFFVERLMDIMAMMVLASFIAATMPRYRIVMWGAAALVAGVLSTLAVLPWKAIVIRLDARARPAHLATKLGIEVAKTLTAARSLLSPGMLAFGFALGIFAWSLEGIGLYSLGSIAHTPNLSLATAVGIYAIAILVGAVSFLPGGLGSTEAVMTALLRAQGYPVGDALLITIACRVVTLWFAVCIGWVAVFILRHREMPVVSSWR